MTERGPAKSRAPCRGRKPPGLFRRGLAMTRRPVCLATRDIRDPDRDDILLARTRGTGSDAVTRAERCFAWRDFPEQAFATGQGMIGLAAEHGDERFDALRAEVLHPDRLAPGFPGTGSGTGGATVADAVLDRIVQDARCLGLKGGSRRKRNKPPPLDGGNDKRGDPA